MNILLTGCAGFIGSHTLDRLLAEGHTVIGVDNFDPFYNRVLKQANIEGHLMREAGCGTRDEGRNNRAAVAGSPVSGRGSFELIEADLAEPETYTKIKFIADGLQRAEGGDLRPEVATNRKPESRPLQVSGLIPPPSKGPLQVSGLIPHPSFDAIIHLAAKAGVRPSIEDPVGYQRANAIATQNLLEFAREQGIRQFVFASSSSVYGVNPDVPWHEDDAVLRPISPYASSKVSCELLGHVYSHLYGIRFLGLRFFTVYGPRQRPDLAINKFVRLIEAGEPIPVFGDGSTRRDYTYVDDIVDGILRCTEKAVLSGPPSTGNRELKTGQPDISTLPAYEVINLGNNRTVSLAELIETIEAVLGKKAEIDRLPEQPGDVPQTWADVSKARELFGYEPKTSFREGIEQFVEWRKRMVPSF